MDGGGRTPSGKWEDDTRKYIDAWEREIIGPLKEMGFRVFGFDPMVSIALDNETAQIPVSMALRFIAEAHR